jgi:hypothetical protein
METRLSSRKSDQGSDNFFIALNMVGVELFGEGGRRRWCGFNASISAQEGR